MEAREPNRRPKIPAGALCRRALRHATLPRQGLLCGAQLLLISPFEKVAAGYCRTGLLSALLLATSAQSPQVSAATSYERLLLGTGPPLELALAPEGRALAGVELGVEESHGATASSVPRCLPGVMRFDTLLKVLGGPDVQGAVGTTEDVDMEDLLLSHTLPFDALPAVACSGHHSTCLDVSLGEPFPALLACHEQALSVGGAISRVAGLP